MTHEYQLLSAEDRAALRLERVRALELDLFRAELANEDALSDAEREGIAADMSALAARLRVHYQALTLTGEKESPDDGG